MPAWRYLALSTSAPQEAGASRPLKIGIICIIGTGDIGGTRLLTAKQLREALGLPAK